MPPQVSPPALALSDQPPSEVSGVEVIALGVLPDGDGGCEIGPGAADLLDRLDLDLFGWLEHHDATGKVGEVVEIPLVGSQVKGKGGTAPLGARSVLLVGLGDQSPTSLRRAAAALARRTRGRQAVAASIAALADDDGLAAIVAGLVLGSFVFHCRSGEPPAVPVRKVVLAAVPDAERRHEVLTRAVAVAGAAWMARTLALVPSNIKSPAWLAEQAERIAESADLDCEVWDERRLAEEGFGGIVGVGQASATPPRLIRLDYHPPGRRVRRVPHVVLVGKGITFDTGGLSIKPAESMTTMKRDMTGGGVVIAVMGALRAVGCPVRVTGLVAAAENAVGAAAFRPGDVLRHYGGRTTEVTNTDAEGRLVMADALAFAVAELAPDALVDIATLTGAIKVSLGQRTGGLFATDDALAERLLDAGRAAGEPVWPMPLVDDYEQLLESAVADADNAPKGHGGAITAALFLRHFTGGLPWAHLDIASVGDSPVDAYEYTPGATGFGARLLLQWLGSEAPLAGVGRS